MKARALLAAALVLPALAAAQERANPWELRIEADRQNLDKGYDDWWEYMAQLSWRPRRSLAVFGGGRETERYAQRDREAFGGFYVPLGSEATTLHVEGSASNTHLVLAKSIVLVEVAQSLGQGWVATVGTKAARYSTGKVETVIPAIERYFGNWRAGYQAYVSRPEGQAWSTVHRLSANWYRGELTYFGVSGARGRETENVFPTGLLVTQVRSATLGGGYELAPQWGVTLELDWVRQGDLYTRRGARVGTRVLF